MIYLVKQYIYLNTYMSIGMWYAEEGKSIHMLSANHTNPVTITVPKTRIRKKEVVLYMF